MERVRLMGSLLNSTKAITAAGFFHGKSFDIGQHRKKTKLQSWIMNLQISQDKYTLF
jgi:hypothetical protein